MRQFSDVIYISKYSITRHLIFYVIYLSLKYNIEKALRKKLKYYYFLWFSLLLTKGMRRVSCITPFTSCMSNYWAQTKAQWYQSIVSTPQRTAAVTPTHGRRWVTQSSVIWQEPACICYNIWLHVSVLACRCRMCFLAMDLGWDMSTSSIDWRTCFWMSSSAPGSLTAQWWSDQPKQALKLNSSEKKCNKTYLLIHNKTQASLAFAILSKIFVH